MEETPINEPKNRFRFNPDFTMVNGWFILVLLIMTILFGIAFIFSYY